MDTERKTRLITKSYFTNKEQGLGRRVLVNAASGGALVGIGYFVMEVGLPFLQRDPTGVPVDKNRPIDPSFTYPSITGWKARLGIDIDQAGLVVLKEHEIEVGHDLLSGRVFGPIVAYISLEIDKDQPGIGIKEEGKLIDYRRLLPLPDNKPAFLPVHLYHGPSRVNRLVHLTRLDQVLFRATIKGLPIKLYQPG